MQDFFEEAETFPTRGNTSLSRSEFASTHIFAFAVFEIMLPLKLASIR